MIPGQKKLLVDSNIFRMIPWLHVHTLPDGRAYPYGIRRTGILAALRETFARVGLFNTDCLCNEETE